MSIKKQYSDSKSMCKVTFKLEHNAVHPASKVTLAGDFNGWDTEALPMKKLQNGEFSVSVNLKKGKAYQFKYLVDGHIWLNDQDADKHVPNAFHSDNSVVVV